MENNIKGQLKHGDLSKIARKSGFSLSTIRKWYNDELKVSASTEEKILSSWTDVLLDENAIIEEFKLKCSDLKNRISNFEEILESSLSQE